MASNKHALIRYRVIDKCLRQIDRQWNWQTLADSCSEEIRKVTGQNMNLSERTIKGDLQNMRHNNALGYFAPIEYDRMEKSYYYSDRSYSITEAPLSRSDSNELKQAIGLLQQFTGFRHLEGIENIIQKLELLAYESTTRTKKIVHIEQAPIIPGQRWLDQLYEAIKSEKTISLSYKPFEKDAYSIVISPYLLKEYDHRWYLYALNHEHQQLRTYGLERIQDLKASLQKYIENTSFDPDTYFNDIIGVTLKPGKKPTKIEFEVYGNTVSYIRTKPLHRSQKEIESKKKVSRYSIEVIPNFELESLFLSFGESLKVLKPKSLHNKLKRRVARLQSEYI